MRAKKKMIGLRVTDSAHELLRALSAHWGVNQTATIERLIRDRAQQEGLRVQAQQEVKA